MKAEDTPQSRLGDQRGLGPREKLCFVQEFCAENCTPRSTWSCKTEHRRKHKACLLFFPLIVVQRQQPRPPKGFTHSCGSGMTAYGGTGRSATLSDLREGVGSSFTSHLCPDFHSGFTSHIGKLQVEVGRVFPQPLLLGMSP